MSSESGRMILQCEECRRVWTPADHDRWRCYLTTDGELVFYCPECAAREFDDSR